MTIKSRATYRHKTRLIFVVLAGGRELMQLYTVVLPEVGYNKYLGGFYGIFHVVVTSV